jgi:hypothetical protein
MNLEGIARSISKVIELAYAHALRADPEYKMLPLSVIIYNDGFHDMMTICAIKIKDDNVKGFKKKTKIESWSYYSTNHADIKRIEVPELSIREREKIHGLMTAHAGDNKLIHDNMGFQLGKGSSSLETLSAYIANQNYCPYVFLSKDNKLRKSIINYFESFI